MEVPRESKSISFEVFHSYIKCCSLKIVAEQKRYYWKFSPFSFLEKRNWKTFSFVDFPKNLDFVYFQSMNFHKMIVIIISIYLLLCAVLKVANNFKDFLILENDSNSIFSLILDFLWVNGCYSFFLKLWTIFSLHNFRCF